MLRYGLTSGRGITLLLGEAGTGKTTLLQTVLAEIGPETAQCVLLSNPTLSRAEFYEFLSDGFGMNGSAGSKTKFLADFREHLDQRHRRGLVTALLLDEAQSLPSELLEEVRLLSNIETTTDKLLNVLLIGQPELADRLNESGLRQLKQRVALAGKFVRSLWPRRPRMSPAAFESPGAFRPTSFRATPSPPCIGCRTAFHA
jgi:type II secretory pathway predicted ATPase ExeA